MKRLRIFLAVLSCVVVAVGLYMAVRRAIELGRIPAYASESVLEARYPKQIARLRSLAESSKDLSRHFTNNEIDQDLFASPEILSASIKTSSNVYRSVSERSHSYKLRKMYWYREPKIGESVANRLYDTTESGDEIDVVEYRCPVINDKGDVMEIYLLFCLDALRSAENMRRPNHAMHGSGGKSLSGGAESPPVAP